MSKEQPIAYEPHPVSAERKAELRGKGYKIIDTIFEPIKVSREDGPTVAEYVAAGYLASNYPPSGYASLSTPDEIAAAIAAQADPIDLGTDSGEQLSDEQLRAAIEAETGAAPHHKTGRAKLIETFNQINARTSSVNDSVENGSQGDAS